MKKRLTFLTCLMMICSFMFGQNQGPDWGEYYGKPYENGSSMTFTVSVAIDGELQNHTDLEVAPYSDGKRYGEPARLTQAPPFLGGKYIAQVIVNAPVNSEIRFRMYDYRINSMFEDYSQESFVFEAGIVGNAQTPQVINFYSPVTNVAEVNGVGYPTLADAYEAATYGETITLISDIADATTIVKPTHNIVIDGNGKTVSGGMSFGSDDNKLDNVNINISNVNFVGEGLIIKELANVTVKNNTFADITKDNGITVLCDNLTETVNVVGNIVDNVVAGTGIRIRNAKEANVNDNTVKNIFNNAILLEGTTYGDVTVTNNLVENWGVAGEGRAIRIVKGANTTVAVKGNAMLHEDAPEEFVKVSSNTANVNIDENYWNGENPVEEKLFSDNNNNNNVCPANYYNGYETTGTSWSLTNRVDLNYVAKAGDVYYESLAEAIAEASTVYILCDTQGAGIVIDKDVTIDFNGHTYTFSELGVGSGTLTSNGFQILKGNNVTLKNGTLNVAEAMKAEYYILVQNYANLNVEKMNLDGTNLDKWSTTDGDSYVLSNNSGEVNIVNTTITANNDGAKAFAFDVCKSTYYTVPVVTLDAESTINGRVELSGGQFYPEKGVTVSLTKEIKAYVDQSSGWYTFSTPFAKDKESINIDGEYDLYRYNETTAIWENYEKEAFDIEVGRGYLYAHAAGNDLTLEGKANVSDYKTTLTYTNNDGHELEGFHLVGNPFTHDIDASYFTGNIADGIYTLNNSGAWQAKQTNEAIAVGEGFLVKATEETIFTISRNQDAKRTESENNGSIQINVANANYNDVAYVSFNEGTGLNKISHRNAEIPMVYVPVNGINYAIAYISQDVTEIPVSFKATTMGQYTISVEAQECEFAAMTLVDRLTGVETNLLLEDYTFIAKTNDNTDRFTIKLDINNELGNSENFAYINNGMMYIYDIDGEAVVNIYDITGRPIAEYNVATSANISTSDLAAGIYIIRMSANDGVKTQKIVIE